MGLAKRKLRERPRELRRRVILPARLRTGADWSDTCILNISSRGLLIQSARPAQPGSEIEVRRGDYTIVARVMWRDGSRLGLQSDERVPVEEIMSASSAGTLQLVAADGNLVERRRRPRRDNERSRERGRMVEFAALVATATILAGCAWGMTHKALEAPFAKVEAALIG